MRIEKHPILKFERGEKVRFTFDGRTLEGFSNESVAAALLGNGIDIFRYSIRENRPRGFFCGIGRCSSCNMVINGVPNVRACVTRVEDGMTVRTQKGKGKIDSPRMNMDEHGL